MRFLIALYNSLNAQSTKILDLSDILRAALVLSVSALDYYIHEVVTRGMLEIYQGNRPEPNPSANTSKSAFSRFQISLDSARQDRIKAINIASWLENEIQEVQGYEFIQQFHTISSLSPIIANCILDMSAKP
ncbi:MAG: hypothetical protein DSM107014_11435 [Gomphosphaeria aponina SAG 52.96 = DSM 107014]|uniref:Uncharacterized protein n=1 Tax=Gomphosphaeria aponina SAG 52.96 = DSM 107014 TaxID=1521640 RepID=A0A941JTF0_9CHRO|nr:hypothetical protein [Gomphosphaeria aponina SAG 52.96 = DSM 107014]